MNAVLNYKEEKLVDPGFGFTIDVSLDSNYGVFRRYHVGNNPVNNIDASGLFLGMSCHEKWDVVCEVACQGAHILACAALCSLTGPGFEACEPACTEVLGATNCMIGCNVLAYKMCPPPPKPPSHCSGGSPGPGGPPPSGPNGSPQ